MGTTDYKINNASASTPPILPREKWGKSTPRSVLKSSTALFSPRLAMRSKHRCSSPPISQNTRLRLRSGFFYSSLIPVPTSQPRAEVPSSLRPITNVRKLRKKLYGVRQELMDAMFGRWARQHTRELPTFLRRVLLNFCVCLFKSLQRRE